MFSKQTAPPASPQQTYAPHLQVEKQLQNLTLRSKKSFDTDSLSELSVAANVQKQKPISKLRLKLGAKSPYIRKKPHEQKRKYTKSKFKILRDRIDELEKQNNSLRRKCQDCSQCNPNHRCNDRMLSDAEILRQQQLFKRIGQYESGGSQDFVQFQEIDITRMLPRSTQYDDKAWVMIGAMMIIMGSKNMDIDGTINTFQVLSNCVDQVRRQVQKSAEIINLQFFCLKEQMRESSGNFIQGLDFDPFYAKTKNGFQIQSVKLQSAEPSQLIYDQKMTFSINYQTLIRAMENLKQNSRIY